MEFDKNFIGDRKWGEGKYSRQQGGDAYENGYNEKEFFKNNTVMGTTDNAFRKTLRIIMN